MYYFTEQDPNYRIQGSRDPLGFQVVWQRVGRQLIKYLSTVSSNIRDFQTLSYAKYFYRDRNPKGFTEFFLKFEQICAYARGVHLSYLNEGFNGIEFINKNKDDEPYSISINPKDTILSNQKTYGILGKYNRPYSAMSIDEADADRFRAVIRGALEKDFKKLTSICDDLLTNKQITVNKEQLLPFADILTSLTPEEKSLYRDYILRVKGDEEHIQNQLYDYMLRNKNICENEDLNFYSFTNGIRGGADHSRLSGVMEDIQNTDKVLYTHIAAFRTLQSKTSWTYEEIKNHKFLSRIPGSVKYHFANDDEINELNSMLDEPDVIKKIEYLVERNARVCKIRNNSPWIQHENNVFKIYYSDGEQSYDRIDRDSNNEFDYFLGSYYKLFKQIEN